MKYCLIFSFLLCSLGVFAQDVFEDVAYEPGLIKYEGLSNSTIEGLANRAFLNIKNYHSKTAQEEFDSILVMDKHNVLGLYGLAYCKFSDGDYENAIEMLDPVLNVNSKNAALYSLRARSYWALDNLAKAVDDFRKAVELGNGDLDILSLSECLFYSGDFNSCISEAEKYISKQDKKPEGYFVKGMAKSEMQDYLGATEILKKVVEVDEENSAGYYQMARNFLLLKENNKALKNLNKALEYDSKNYQALDMRAEIKYINHDYANAIIDCNSVIQLDEETKFAYLTRGKSNLKLGLKKDACADFKKALELGNKAAEELIGKNCN